MSENEFYHIRITRDDLTISKPRWTYEINLTRGQILNHFFIPFDKGDAVICNGAVFTKGEITSIKVYQTNNKIEHHLIMHHDFELDKKIMNEGIDKTRYFIDESKKMKTKTISLDKNQVFIVHGHDDKSKLELARLLENDFKLKVLILHEQPNKGNTIIEKLERYSQYPGFVFVLLTPDDFGGKNININSKKRQSKFRARQNVILELGYFLGKLGRERVCCLYKNGVEIPSDINGVLYIPFKDNIKDCYQDIKIELESVGMIYN
jgi:predicted nucleotide-binding protein